MSVLFNLPSDIYHFVCSEWLGTLCLLLLDSAMSQKALRPTLLLQLNDCIIDIKVQSVGFLNWVYARKIRLNRLELRCIMFDEEGYFKCNVDFKQLKELSLLYLKQIHLPAIISMLGLCSNLTSFGFCVNDFSYSDCPLDDFVLRKLASLIIINWGEDGHTRWYKAIELNCKQLTRLELPIARRPEVITSLYSNCVCKIVESNTNLLSVVLNGSFKVLQTLSKLCKNLNYVNFLTNDAIEQSLLSVASELIGNCKGACTFSISGPMNNFATLLYSVTGSVKSLRVASKYELTGINEFLRGFKGLAEVIYGCRVSPPNDAQIKDILFHSASTLINIVIDDSRALSVNTLQRILQCKKLERLSIVIEQPDDMVYDSLLSVPLTLQYLHLRLRQCSLVPLITLFNTITTLKVFNLVGLLLHQSETPKIISYLQEQASNGRLIDCILTSYGKGAFKFTSGKLMRCDMMND